MREPRYLYQGDFSSWRDALERDLPHAECCFQPGDRLWELGSFIDYVYYLDAGVVKTAVVHEDGRVKVLYFSGAGSVYPGCHEAHFAIELSIVSTAVTKLRALRFRRADFHAYALRNPRLLSDMLELYASWINLHIYESAHQGYNSAYRRLCNLLLLVADETSGGRIDLTQQDLADILLLEREVVSRALGRLRAEELVATHRGWLEVKDKARLAALCSFETSGGEIA